MMEKLFLLVELKWALKRKGEKKKDAIILTQSVEISVNVKWFHGFKTYFQVHTLYLEGFL